MKLSPAGKIIYSTYIGGSGSENYCLNLTLDDSGKVYVGFTTYSDNYPATKNAYQISPMCISLDFPATLIHTEPDSTWTNCIWKIDLNDVIAIGSAGFRQAQLL